MRILIIHEIDWLKKIIFEPHHFSELFSNQGHKVFVIDCPSPDFRNFTKGMRTEIIHDYHRIYEKAKITLIRPPSLRIKGLNRLTNFLNCKKTIKNVIQKYNIDIILLYGVATNGIQTIEVAKQLHVPVIYRALDVAHGLVNIPIIRQQAKKYEKSVIKNSTIILTTTNDLGKYIVQMGGDKHIVEEFPLGVNTEQFKPYPKDQELLNQLKISSEEKIIVFMGTLYKFSGIDNIIKNFEKLERQFKIKFLIIGGGPSFNHLKSLTKKRNLESKIIFTNFIPQKEISRYLSLADLCLNPFEINFITENIVPTKILEYLACGKPVLSTPLRGTKNILPNEDYGIVYSTNEYFVDSIIDFLKQSEKLEKLGQLGLEYILKNHDWNNLSERLLKKFEYVINNTKN